MRLLLLTLLAAVSSVSAQSIVVEENPALRELVPADAMLERLADGFQFTEGPAWDPTRGRLVFSDIPADKLYVYDPATRAASVLREPSQHSNGNTTDAVGNVYSCEHGSRSVTVAPHGDGERRTLADRYEGKPLNSPNDIVLKSDGTIWFTDPTYGLAKGQPKDQSTNNVYCLDPKTGELRAVVTDFIQPNGLCFSPDEKFLYVTDTDKPRHVRVFDVTADHQLVNGRVFCQTDKGAPDGIRCDRHGNLWSSAGDGVHVFAPDGTRLGKILVPETPANLCFGGPAGDELFITAKTSLYHIRLTTTAR